MRCSLLVLVAVLGSAPARADLHVTATDSLALPAGQVTGVAWTGGETLAMLVSPVDSLAGDRPPQVFLVVGDTTGAVLWQEDFTGVLARGLAWDGANFWSCGDDAGGGSVLYKIPADSVHVAAAFPTPGHHPMDLAWDGRWLWLTDRDNGRIDRIDPQTGEVTRSVPAPGFSPVGLAWDGESMWVTDPATGLLCRLQGARLERWDPVAASSWFQLGRDALLAYDGSSLWVLVAGDPHLVRLRLE